MAQGIISGEIPPAEFPPVPGDNSSISLAHREERHAPSVDSLQGGYGGRHAPHFVAKGNYGMVIGSESDAVKIFKQKASARAEQRMLDELRSVDADSVFSVNYYKFGRFGASFFGQVCQSNALVWDGDASPEWILFPYAGPDLLAAKLPLRAALGSLRQIVDGLPQLAEAQIMHNDIKITNVVVKNGIAKLIDFGIATKVTDAVGMLDRLASYEILPPVFAAARACLFGVDSKSGCAALIRNVLQPIAKVLGSMDVTQFSDVQRVSALHTARRFRDHVDALQERSDQLGVELRQLHQSIGSEAFRKHLEEKEFPFSDLYSFGALLASILVRSFRQQPSVSLVCKAADLIIGLVEPDVGLRMCHETLRGAFCPPEPP